MATRNVNPRKAIHQIVEAIRLAVNPTLIILFGSQAGGGANPDSDVDLLVVEDAPFGSNRSRRQETVRIMKAISEFPMPVDLLLYSRDEVEHWRHSVNHVVGRAFKEGLVVYERP